MTMLETGRRVGVSSAVLGALALSFAAQAAPVDCAGGGQCVVSDVDGSINVVANSPAITTDGFGFNVKNAGGLSWNVNGTNILFSQSSFYRVNGAGQESPVGGLLWSTATEDSTEKQIRIRTEDGGQGIVVGILDEGVSGEHYPVIGGFVREGSGVTPGAAVPPSCTPTAPAAEARMIPSFG